MDTVRIHFGSSECGGGGELRLQSSYTAWSVRGKSTVPPPKRHLSFHLPILVDPRRGSWETLNSTVVSIDIAGSGGGPANPKLNFPCPAHPNRAQ